MTGPDSMSTASPNHFNAFAKNVHSQYGEDGIIEEILKRLDAVRLAGPRYCVEFGAWDGKHLSNTYRLITDCNYRAVLIEADPAKCKALSQNLPQSSVVKMNRFVSFEGPSTLDGLLSETDIPMTFDLLSIDIDGNDYYILESLQKYRPILVCIEFNPTIPNAVDYVQPKDFRVKHGSSAKSIAALAASKGYAVVAATHCNLLLLDRSHLTNVGLSREPSLDEVRDDQDAITYVFCGYDGKLLLSKPLRMPWHGLQYKESDLQSIPFWLRRFPDDYNPLQRLAWLCLKALRSPVKAFRKIRSKLPFHTDHPS
jgi:hypothetical protein